MVALALIYDTKIIFSSDTDLSGSLSEASPDVVSHGRTIAQTYCTSCHRFPEPDLLTKNVWSDQTLPAMGPLLGIFKFNGTEYPHSQSEHLPENYYPSEPMLSSDDWAALMIFYEVSAPTQFMSEAAHKEIVFDSLSFTSLTPEYQVETPPTSTIAKMDPVNRRHYLSDVDGTSLMIFNENLALEQSLVQSGTLLRITSTSRKKDF